MPMTASAGSSITPIVVPVRVDPDCVPRSTATRQIKKVAAVCRGDAAATTTTIDAAGGQGKRSVTCSGR
jgi:hypothetical protein